MILSAILAALSFQGEAPPEKAKPEPKPPPKVVALVGATVHTMVGTDAPAVATILVQGDRILAVGPSVAIPADAVRIDVSGKHVIPGLIDAMVNHDADHDRLYVTSGVTLVRDVGNDLARIFAERDKDGKSMARERGPGPAILSCGAVLDGSPPSTTAAVVLDSPDVAEEKLGRLVDLQPEFLSFHLGLTEPVWRKVIEFGHSKGLTVWGPKLPGVSAAKIVQAGQDGLFHLDAFLPEAPAGKDGAKGAAKGWADVTLDDLQPALDVLAKPRASKKIAVTPTLAVFGQRLIEPRDHPPELAYLGPMYVQSWIAEAGMRGKLMLSDKEYFQNGLRVVETQGKLVRALHERGVPIVPGSASPNAWIFPGEGLIDELSLLTRAGIPKAQVLFLATSGAAEVLGVKKDRGTIEAGKIADLVVLSGDPTTDFAVLHVPETVVLRGRVLDRATMEALRKDLADTQKRIQAEAFKPLVIPDPPLPPGEVLLRGTVETRAMGQRLRGESYAVVQAEDKSLVYTSRMLTPGSASSASSDVEIQQTIRDGALAGFEVKIKSGGHLVDVQGILAGGYLNVERHLDGGFAGNLPVRDRLSFVDAGCVTAAIAMGQLPTEGKFKVLFFDDLDPAIGNWEMHVDKDGAHLAKTHAGAMKVHFAADGSVGEMQREEGRGITTTRPLSSQATKGGLPVPQKKKG
ncbi:MAG TPA: amidohydrolase family protein [Planctomycetota bacterium]|jgi:hypothetical protein|nr:amidohydrolase family protein [Planctomycetota bacterium]